MPNVLRQITLLTKEEKSGPVYDVYYSVNCIDYTISTSSPIYLENIGDSAIVEVPDNINCIKLFSDNAFCENDVLLVVGTTTSTSTSTTSTSTSTTSTTSTSTTSTTSTSTTSTTTAAPNPCRCYEVIFGAGGGEINYNNCAGETFNFASNGAGTFYRCAQVVGGLAQIFVVSGTVTLNIVGNCLTGDCPPATTTTLCPCVQNVVIQVDNTTGEGSVNWLTCTGVSDGGFYPNGEYTITSCIQRDSIVGSFGAIVTIVNSGECCTITTTSTTTTTTAPPTTTTTTSPEGCKLNTTINVTDTGWIRWTLCDGTSVDTFLSSLGTYTITQCIQYGSIRSAFPLADLASWDNVVWGTPCTTTTTAPPTTTTTTETCYDCDDGFVSGFYGGTDYYAYPARVICPTGVASQILYWDVIERPNRFTIYDSTGLITTTGWVGQANYPGPWGVSLNTPTTGIQPFTFVSTFGRYILVEAGPAAPSSFISDAYNFRLVCNPTTTTTTAPPTTTTTTRNLCGCTTYTLSNPNSPGTQLAYEYTVCGTGEVVRGGVRYNIPVTFCAVTDTVQFAFPSIDIGADCSTGICEAVNPYTNSGYGYSVPGACLDASVNNRTLYSNCDQASFGVGCYVYVDSLGNPLEGYDYVFINSANWNLRWGGYILGLSDEQC